MSGHMNDLAFLIEAANYQADLNAPHCPAARKAVDAVAERLRLEAEAQLKRVREEIELNDPAGVSA